MEELVDKPLGLSAADLEKMPRRTVEAKDHDGKAASFTGVALASRDAGGFGPRARVTRQAI